jgi:hypothetical protein
MVNLLGQIVDEPAIVQALAPANTSPPNSQVSLWWYIKGREGPMKRRGVRKLSIVVYWSQTVVMKVLLFFAAILYEICFLFRLLQFSYYAMACLSYENSVCDD